MVEGGEDAVGIGGACRGSEGKTGGHEGVLHLELPDQRKAEFPRTTLEDEPHGLRETLRPDGLDPQFPAAAPDRADRPPGPFGRGDDPVRIGTVGVDDGRAARRQQIGEQALSLAARYSSMLA